MPDGNTHKAITSGAGLVALGTWIATGTTAISPPVIAGLFLLVCSSPQILTNPSENAGTGGCTASSSDIGGISHWPVIGTLTRLSYLGATFGPILALATLRYSAPRFGPDVSRGLVLCFAGLALADTLHYFADILDTEKKTHLEGKLLLKVRTAR